MPNHITLNSKCIPIIANAVCASDSPSAAFSVECVDAMFVIQYILVYAVF